MFQEGFILEEKVGVKLHFYMFQERFVLEEKVGLSYISICFRKDSF